MRPSAASPSQSDYDRLGVACCPPASRMASAPLRASLTRAPGARVPLGACRRGPGETSRMVGCSGNEPDADIRKALITQPPPGVLYSCVSRLPLNWLQARWNAVYQPMGGWCPGFSLAIESRGISAATRRSRVRYTSAAGAAGHFLKARVASGTWSLPTPTLARAILALDGGWEQPVRVARQRPRRGNSVGPGRRFPDRA